MSISEVLSILNFLGKGYDPMTGKTLPDDSPYQNPRVVWALNTALRLLSESNPGIPINETPLDAGAFWSREEEQQLLGEFAAGVPLVVMMRNHRRTRGAITACLHRLGKKIQFNYPIYPRTKTTTASSGRTTSSLVRKKLPKPRERRAGSRWTPEDHQTLFDCFAQKLPFEDIARRLRRGVLAVKIKLFEAGKISRDQLA